MHNREGGFTLIEVLVAFAILSISLGVLLGSLSDGLSWLNRTKSEVVASQLAQSMLARIGPDIPLQVGVTDGHFTNGFKWRLRILPYGETDKQQLLSVAAYTVTIEVTWPSGASERSTTLSSLRLSPKRQQLW